jgi:hypothetical protein
MGRTAVLAEVARRSVARRWAVGTATLRPDGFGPALGDAVAAAAGSLAARRPGGSAPALLRAALDAYRAEVETPAGGPADLTTGAEASLRRLFKAVGTTAAGVGWGVCLLLDDLQHATTAELGALVEAGCDAADRGWAVAVVGAALPSVEARLEPELGAALAVGPLDRAALADAVAGPLDGVGGSHRTDTGTGSGPGPTPAPSRAPGPVDGEGGIDADALDAVGALSGGCPLLVQAYAAAAWDAAGGQRIALRHVELGRQRAEQDLERRFFAGSLAGLAPHERRYLRAMAELGDTGVPADALARRLGDNGRPGGIGARAAGVRAHLERLGLIHSVGGDRLDFSLPLLGGYLRSRG